MRPDRGLLPEDALAAMFEGRTPDDLTLADFDGEPGFEEEHYHTEDLAAFIVSGRIAFDIGPGFSDRLVFGAGDCVFLPAMLPHREEVLGEERVVARVAWVTPYETEAV
jgi:mannose-6-phosphate isomerase-like protein (cupin superfamily)